MVYGEGFTGPLLLHVWLAHPVKPKPSNIIVHSIGIKKHDECSPAESLQVSILLVLEQHVIEPCFVF